MENKVSSRPFLPIPVVFIVSCLFIFFFRSLLALGGFDYRVLLGGNVLLFAVTFFSFKLYTKALRNNNAHAFVRVMYGSLLVKLVACLVATLLYAWSAGRSANRNAIFGCFGLYIVYTWLEVRILMQMSKKSPGNV